MILNFPSDLHIFNVIFLLSLLLTTAAQSVSIGDDVCVAGYIMDKFCIDQGKIMDKPSVSPLSAEGPPAHSLRCLVDMGVCNSSPYEVLVELEDGSYGRAWQAHSNELLLNHVRAIGVCKSCASENTEEKGNISRGYKATVVGTVKEPAMGDIPPGKTNKWLLMKRWFYEFLMY